jgi:SulP family sulfate permease
MFDKQSLALLKHKGTIIDFVVILAVVISAVSMSLVVAAGVGIAMSIILFLRDQMRTSVIHRTLNGTQTFSKKSRPQTQHEILEKHGTETIIVELQGQLFFGTTDQLYTKLDKVLTGTKYLILDMKRVQSVDYTGVNLMKQMLKRLKDNKGFLIFSSIPISLPTGLNLTQYLSQLGLSDEESLKYFDDLNAALQWAEDETIRSVSDGKSEEERVLPIGEIELLKGLPDAALSAISTCITEKRFGKGELIFKKNDKSDEIYFVGKGSIRIILPISAMQSHVLVTLAQGSVFGEMAFIDHIKRSADALADEECVVYVLSRGKFEEVSKQHPGLAGILFERLALLMANRLRQSNTEIKSLQEN